MSVIQYTSQAIDDMLRLVMFVYETEPSYADQTANVIENGIMVLHSHPLIGRTLLKEDVRELVISHGKSGYIALDKYDGLRDIVTVLAIRHQREVDYH